MSLTLQDIRNLIDFLGHEGASLGLEQSHFTVLELKGLLESAGHKMPTKARRKDIVAQIMTTASMRVDLPLEELMAMSYDNLLRYFEERKPNNRELLNILGKLDFHPGSEARRSLYKYAARQIAETGMFQRVAESNGKS